MKGVPASVALLQLRPKAAGNDCLAVLLSVFSVILGSRSRGYLVSGIQLRFALDVFAMRNSGWFGDGAPLALLADISTRASARLDAGPFFLNWGSISRLIEPKKEQFLRPNFAIISAWFQLVAQELRRRLRTPTHSLSVRIM
jgi:hypothetical protein